MTRQDIIDDIWKENQTRATKTEVQEIVSATFRLLARGLKVDQRAVIKDFGTFKVAYRAPKKGRNPQTGEEMLNAAYNHVSFKPAPTLKDIVQ